MARLRSPGERVGECDRWVKLMGVPRESSTGSRRQGGLSLQTAWGQGGLSLKEDPERQRKLTTTQVSEPEQS